MAAVIREPIHPNTAIIWRPSPGLARLLTSTRRLQDAELVTGPIGKDVPAPARLGSRAGWGVVWLPARGHARLRRRAQRGAGPGAAGASHPWPTAPVASCSRSL